MVVKSKILSKRALLRRIVNCTLIIIFCYNRLFRNFDLRSQFSSVISCENYFISQYNFADDLTSLIEYRAAWSWTHTDWWNSNNNAPATCIRNRTLIAFNRTSSSAIELYSASYCQRHYNHNILLQSIIPNFSASLETSHQLHPIITSVINSITDATVKRTPHSSDDPKLWIIFLHHSPMNHIRCDINSCNSRSIPSSPFWGDGWCGHRLQLNSMVDDCCVAVENVHFMHCTSLLCH